MKESPQSINVLYCPMPFASPATVKYAEKSIACLALACNQLFVAGDQRINVQHISPPVQYYLKVSHLHYLNDMQPKWLSAIWWIMKLIIIQCQLCWTIVKLRQQIEVVVFFNSNYYTFILLCVRLLGKKGIFFEPGNGIVATQVYYQRYLWGYLVIYFTRLMRYLNRNLAHFCVVESHHEIELAELTAYSHKTRFCGNHVDMEFYKPLVSIQERPQTIGFLGRLTPEKGVMALLKAMTLQPNQNISLHILGDGPLRSEVETFIQQANLSQVKLIGWVDKDTIVQHLNQFRLLILPTHGEGIPNVILEAMACGTPALAPAVGGIPDLIEDKVTGFTLPDVNPETIAQAIDEALNYPELELISRYARAHIEQNHSIQAVSKKWAAIFAEVITKNVTP